MRRSQTDEERDDEFYEEPTRFFLQEDLELIRELLLTTNTSFHDAVSECGIDPDSLEEEDIREAKRSMGVKYSKKRQQWIED